MATSCLQLAGNAVETRILCGDEEIEAVVGEHSGQLETDATGGTGDRSQWWDVGHDLRRTHRARHLTIPGTAVAQVYNRVPPVGVEPTLGSF